MPDPKVAGVPHAITRALERYGLKLTVADLRAMALACAEGSCRLAKMKDNTEKHMIMCHGRAMVVIYKPYMGPSNLANPHRGAGTIITALPKEAALAGNSRSPATKFKRRTGKDYKAPKSRRKGRGY